MSFNQKVKSLLGACLITFGGQVSSYEDLDANVYDDLTGIYSDKYEGIDVDTGYEVITSIPNLGIRVSDWPKIPEEKEKITLGPKRFAVLYTEIDGEGGAVVFLEKIV